MEFKRYSFKDLLENIVDNRGKTCPVESDGIPLIATNCIKDNSLYAHYERVRYVSDDTYKTWFRAHPQPEDIIFVCKGSPGRVAWVQNPVPYCIAQDMVAIRAKKNLINSKFLFALLRNPKTQKSILNMHVGTMIPHFKKGDFSNLYFDIPDDLKYQKWAGDLYFNFCERIELNKQTNQTLEKMAQALFKSWFVDFDPVFDNLLATVDFKLENLPNDFDPVLLKRAEKRLLALDDNTKTALLSASLSSKNISSESKSLENKSSENESAENKSSINIHQHFPNEFEYNEQLGWIPKGWEVSELSNLINIKHGYAFKGEYFSDDKTNNILLTPGNVSVGGGFKNAKYKYYNGPIVEEYVFKEGDVYLNMTDLSKASDTLGYPAVVPEINGITFHHNQRLGKVIYKKHNSAQKEFIYQVLCSHQSRNNVLASATGTTVKHTSPSKILSLSICHSSGIIEGLFENYVKPIYQKTAKNSLNNLELTKLRDTLLPKLISGELQIPDGKVIEDK